MIPLLKLRIFTNICLSSFVRARSCHILTLMKPPPPSTDANARSPRFSKNWTTRKVRRRLPCRRQLVFVLYMTVPCPSVDLPQSHTVPRRKSGATFSGGRSKGKAKGKTTEKTNKKGKILSHQGVEFGRACDTATKSTYTEIS